MPTLIAFLRAINVGGHTVKMDALRSLFELFGFGGVETFIASGNVIFQADASDTGLLERRIADGLKAALGYEVATFIRTPAELGEIAVCQPFSAEEMSAAAAFNVAFLGSPPDAPAQERLMALRSEIDQFAVRGREVYWLCRVKQSQSTFSGAALERALKQPATFRGISTITKLAAKLGVG